MKRSSPKNPRNIALAKSVVALISCCIVGKAGAPPNENNIVPNPNANLVRSTSLWTTCEGSLESGNVAIDAKSRTQARPVATVAPTAIGLQMNKIRSTVCHLELAQF